MTKLKDFEGARVITFKDTTNSRIRVIKKELKNSDIDDKRREELESERRALLARKRARRQGELDPLLCDEVVVCDGSGMELSKS